MKSELKVFKCQKCGAMVEELVPCHCPCKIQCCGEEMQLLTANTADGAKEKHVPVYEKVEDEIYVKVGEVPHPMAKEHYIMWIAMVWNDRIEKVILAPEQDPIARFPYRSGATIYAYCNTHGLYSAEVE